MVALYQLAIIPVMIHGWGMTLYGEWLLVTGIATYITVSSHGLTAASAMAIVRQGTAGDHRAANGTIAASLAAVLAVSMGLTALVAALFAWAGLAGGLSITRIAPADLVWITLACGIQMGGASFRTLPIAACDAQGYYGRPQVLSSAFRLVEFAGTVILILGRSAPIAVAWWMAAIVLADCVAQTMLARHQAPWARFRLRTARLATLGQLAWPSAGHTVISVAVNAISVQGLRMVVGAVLGPAAVAMWSVYSAITRITDHLAAMVLPVLQLEFARMAGQGSPRHQSLRLIAICQIASIAVLAACTLALMLFGEVLMQVLGAGQVPFHGDLFLLVSLAVLCVQLGRSQLTYLMGHNLVGRVALAMLAGWLFALALAVPATAHAGLAGTAMALTLGEAAASLAATWLVARHIALPLTHHFVTSLDPRALISVLGNVRSHFRKATTA